MKNFILFVIVVLFYLFLTYLDKTYISTDSKVIDFLMKDYPNTVVQEYVESQKKWWWVNYLSIPLFIVIKVLLIAFCLNFIKLFDLPNVDKIKFGNFVFVTLIAEFIFIIASFYKFINFYWLNTEYTLEDVQTYYPLSLLNFKENISTEKWLAYPLQLVNIFELFYWLLLTWGIRELLEEKISYVKSFGLVSVTYGAGILFWAATVCFLILNTQY
ncbi:hypothetical protein KCF3NO3_03540 [Chryseobacterium sp. KCF3-3]